MRKLAFLFLILSIQMIYAGGLSAWTEKTPYGHEIYHDGTSSGWITLSLDTTSVSFKKFYFYKNHTIAHTDSTYYIINENTENVQQFESVDIWKSKLKEQNLVPFIMREYDYNYSSAFGSGYIFLILLLPFPFFFPILWLICLISLGFPNRTCYGFRKHFSWIYPTVCILIIFIDSTPQSI